MANNSYAADLKSGKIDRSNFNLNLKFLDGTRLINEDIRILEIAEGTWV